MLLALVLLGMTAAVVLALLSAAADRWRAPAAARG